MKQFVIFHILARIVPIFQIFLDPGKSPSELAILGPGITDLRRILIDDGVLQESVSCQVLLN